MSRSSICLFDQDLEVVEELFDEGDFVARVAVVFYTMVGKS